MELLPLVCFCLLICSGTTFGDEVIKMRVKEDEDVILPCSLDSTDIRSEIFDWKKDNQKEVFLYEKADAYNSGRGGQDQQFKGRVFHFEDQLQSGNASIVIRKSKVKDTGSYSCIFPHHQPRIRSIIELIVGSCPKPSVTILDQTKDWALLECEVQGVFPKPKVQWLDSENKTVPAEEPQETESEGKYNIILKVTVTKSDVYRCVSTQEGICHQIDQKINVYWDDKDPDSFTEWIVGVVGVVGVSGLVGVAAAFGVVVGVSLTLCCVFCKRQCKKQNSNKGKPEETNPEAVAHEEHELTERNSL